MPPVSVAAAQGRDHVITSNFVPQFEQVIRMRPLPRGARCLVLHEGHSTIFPRSRPSSRARSNPTIICPSMMNAGTPFTPALASRCAAAASREISYSVYVTLFRERNSFAW